MKVSEKPTSSGLLKSNFELKMQNLDSHIAFL